MKITIIIIASIIVSSCSQDDQVLDVASERISEDITSLDQQPISFRGYPTYEIDPSILAHFIHYCQLDAYRKTPSYLSDYESRLACGPTSYMMAAYALAKSVDPQTNYRSNGQKLGSIHPIIDSYVGGGSITLPSLKWYADTYDYSFIDTSNKYTTSRNNIKNFIKNSLSANKFVIVAVNALCYNSNDVNNTNLYSNIASNKDMSGSGNVTTGNNRNYIVSLDENGSNVGGHIIVIIGLTETAADGSGYVEYIDPLADTNTQSSNRKYVSFTRLLDSMSWNGYNNGQYDAISISL